MPEILAARRWWIVALAVALATARIIAAITISRLGGEPAGAGLAALTACDVACLLLAIIAIIAFVLYGRIYNARIPTE